MERGSAHRAGTHPPDARNRYLWQRSHPFRPGWAPSFRSLPSPEDRGGRRKLRILRRDRRHRRPVGHARAQAGRPAPRTQGRLAIRALARCDDGPDGVCRIVARGALPTPLASRDGGRDRVAGRHGDARLARRTGRRGPECRCRHRTDRADL